VGCAHHNDNAERWWAQPTAQPTLRAKDESIELVNGIIHRSRASFSWRVLRRLGGGRRIIGNLVVGKGSQGESARAELRWLTAARDLRSMERRGSETRAR